MCDLAATQLLGVAVRGFCDGAPFERERHAGGDECQAEGLHGHSPFVDDRGQQASSDGVILHVHLRHASPRGWGSITARQRRVR